MFWPITSGEQVNSIVNTLVRRAIDLLMAKRWAGLLVLAGGAVLAIAGPYVAGEPDAPGPAVRNAQGTYALTGRVVQVSDGDTFNVQVQGRTERVRLASIDAPEMQNKDRRGQPYAQASKRALSDLLSGKTLTLACYELDRYERNICDVPLDTGMTANQMQVANGMAWANMEGKGKFMRDSKLPGLEQEARGKRIGIWQQPDAVRPWEWRYRCWQQHQC